MQISEIEHLLDRISIFGAIDRTYLERIIEHCSCLEKKEGEFLFKENDPATEIFIIIEGKIKLVQNYGTTPLELIELSAGKSTGETSLLGIQPHGSTAVVTEDARLLVLSRNILNKIHELEPEVFIVLMLNITREIARRLHRNRKTLNAIRKLSV